MQKYDSYKDSGVQWIGDIPDHWEIMKLKYILRAEKYACKTGPFGTQLKGNDLQPEGDVRVYNQRNVIYDNFESVNFYVTNQKAESLDSFYTQPNDLLVTSRGTIGRCSILPNDVPMGILHPCLIALRIDESKCLTQWLKLFINESDAFATNIFLNSNATTIEVIYTDTIKNVDVTIPSIPEQQKLLDFLDNKCTKIDNVIATQEKRVELLRELKQSIITRAVTRGINPDAKMKDSGVEWIGEIPEHWEVVQLKHVLHGMQDGTHGTYTRIDSPYYLLSAKNVFEDGLHISNTESAISEKDYNAIVSNGYPAKGDIAICCVGTIGRCCIYEEENIYAFQRSVTFLRCKQSINNKFLLYSLRSKVSVEQILQLAKTSAQSGIYMGALATIKLLLPTLSEQQQIVTYIEQQTNKLDRSITKALRQIELLKEYKQSLITEVVTGKRKVI